MQMAFKPGDKLLQYRLVRKLGEGGANVQIDTVRGIGYRMVLPAEANA